MRLELDPDLAFRLAAIARGLGRRAEDCARAALLAYVEDCEQAATARSRLAGGDHWVREEDYFMD
ncbi:hypothetical protein [Phaeospirillum tilakii]|uniref:RHH-type transcriptional regulator, rel operon repressor / antitoxin RelB n=1 Tax=Phaeospirillum tilakii TaxID=741673 RepID=A0ABW5C8S7_9PROT